MSRPVLPFLFLLLLASCWPTLTRATAVDPLNRQLQLLIPGESAEHRSARAYTQSKIESLVAELRRNKIAR
jgi:hypothetical protein